MSKDLLVHRFREIGGVLRYLLRPERGYSNYVKDLNATIDKITPSQIPNKNTFSTIDTVTQKIFAVESADYRVDTAMFPFHSESIKNKVFEVLASQQIGAFLQTSADASHLGLIFEALYVTALRQEQVVLTTTVS